MLYDIEPVTAVTLTTELCDDAFYVDTHNHTCRQIAQLTRPERYCSDISVDNVRHCMKTCYDAMCSEGVDGDDCQFVIDTIEDALINGENYCNQEINVSELCDDRSWVKYFETQESGRTDQREVLCRIKEDVDLLLCTSDPNEHGSEIGQHCRKTCFEAWCLDDNNNLLDTPACEAVKVNIFDSMARGEVYCNWKVTDYDIRCDDPDFYYGDHGKNHCEVLVEAQNCFDHDHGMIAAHCRKGCIESVCECNECEPDYPERCLEVQRLIAEYNDEGLEFSCPGDTTTASTTEATTTPTTEATTASTTEATTASTTEATTTPTTVPATTTTTASICWDFWFKGDIKPQYCTEDGPYTYETLDECKRQCLKQEHCGGIEVGRKASTDGECYVERSCNVSQIFEHHIKIDEKWNVHTPRECSQGDHCYYIWFNKAITTNNASGCDKILLNQRTVNQCREECERRGNCRGFQYGNDFYDNHNGECMLITNCYDPMPYAYDTDYWHFQEKMACPITQEGR